MKNILKLTLFLIITNSLLSSCSKEIPNFYHVLMIEFTPNANITKITREILLFKKIPSVIDLAFGEVKKNEKNKIQNFKYCLLLKFKDKEGLDNYLKDAYHQKIYKKHKPFIKTIYTVDFNAVSLKE